LHIYAARLALLLGLVEDPDAAEIQPDTLAAAITIADWFGHEAERIYAVMSADRDDAELVDVAEFVRRKGGRISVRGMTRLWRKFRDDKDGAEEILQRLVRAGWGEWSTSTTKKGGRPKTEFVLNCVDETSKNVGNWEVTSTSREASASIQTGGEPAGPALSTEGNVDVTPKNTGNPNVTSTQSVTEKSWPEGTPRPEVNPDTGLEEMEL
jgi:hypothetical protein